jgi:uncharacterized protein YndB with AHSA1/START domain
METTTEAAVERRVEIDARPETVWEFLVDPAKMERWMGSEITLEPRAGGAYRVNVIEGHVASGEVVEVDPPRRLVHTFGWEPEGGNENPVGPGSTRIEIELEPSGDGTTLTFRHTGLPGAEAAGAHAHGWDHYLARLVVAAQGGDPGADTGPAGM